MAFLVEDLIEAVKRRSYIPISQGTESDSSLIERLNDEMTLSIVPAIESVKENYWLTYERQAITALQSMYNIPVRASGTALKDIWLLDASNNRMRPLARTDVHNISSYQSAGNSVVECLVSGNQITIFPTPSSTTGTLEFWFYIRPNRLIATSSCAKITATSTATGSVTMTVDTDLTGSLSVGSLVDFTKGTPPFTLQAYNATITAISSTQIVVALVDIDDELGVAIPAVGDYISPATYSNIAQIPLEFHPILAQATAVAALESQGDLQKRAAAGESYARMLTAALKLISNRIESEPEVIMGRNAILTSIGNSNYGYQTVWR